MRPAEYWGGGSPVQRFLRGSGWAFARSLREAGRPSDVRFLHHLGSGAGTASPDTSPPALRSSTTASARRSRSTRSSEFTSERLVATVLNRPRKRSNFTRRVPPECGVRPAVSRLAVLAPLRVVRNPYARWAGSRWTLPGRGAILDRWAPASLPPSTSSAAPARPGLCSLASWRRRWTRSSGCRRDTSPAFCGVSA